MGLSVLPILCALLLVPLFLSRYFIPRKHASGLPGPARTPILGNRLPPSKVWEAFAKYSKEFGPVFGLQILFRDIVVVNSVAAARDFFEARSSIYSGRKAPKTAELCGMDEGIVFQADGSRLRQGRRFLASGLHPNALKTYQPLLHQNVATFLNRILNTPEKFRSHIRMLPTGVALEMAYGYRATSENDLFVQHARTSFQRFSKATALSPKEGFAVNWLPFLMYVPSFIPGMSFKHIAMEWRQYGWETAVEGFNMVKKSMADGTARPSVVSRALDAKDGTYEDAVVMRSALQFYSGGADTSSSALTTFILAMTLHPEVQSRAQAEVDQRLLNKGTGVLPNYTEDRDALPYVYAIVREVLRWHGPVTTTMRTATKDDVYEGHVIKKGTMVLVNLWAMLHDESVFPDYEVFRPERWLDGTILEKHDADPLDVIFGFGRRVCPGRYLAADLLFTTIASMLTVFTITKAKDANGNEITPTEEYLQHFIIEPVSFQCEIKSRSDATKQLVEDAASVLT